MQAPAPPQRRDPGAPPRIGPLPIVLSYGFRPFFLAAGVWSAAAIGVWIMMLTEGLRIPTRLDPLSWHVHEMFFGFVLAAVAGFLLTAVATWTARRPVSGALLGALVGLWVLGRADSLISQWLPVGLAIAADMAFPLALTGIVAWQIIAADNRRNFPIIVPLVALTAAQLLVDFGMAGFAAAAACGWRLALAAILMLISVVGGRIIPSFTRNWLTARGETRLPRPAGTVDRLALGVLLASLIAWVFFPGARAAGIGLLGAAALNLWRLLGWRSVATRPEALLAVLHAGYAWLVLGLAALGLATLDPIIPLSAAVHALTAGAIGTMILAVMTRVSRGHTGRPLTADRATALMYTLVVLAAAARVAAALAGATRRDLLLGAAALWIGAFGLFVVCYAPLLLGPRSDR